MCVSIWIDNQTVNNAQASGDTSLIAEAGAPFCMSGDRTYCILVRTHAAWYVDGEGWRNGNYPPEGDSIGRPMLNFFKRQVGDETGYWFKMFIPKAVVFSAIEDVDGHCCEAMIDSDLHRLTYTDLDRMKWDMITGRAEPEEEIEGKFAKMWLR